MANAKISALTALTTPTDDDILVLVDDPGGTPETKKMTWANLKATLKTYNDTLYLAAFGQNYIINSDFSVQSYGAGAFASTTTPANNDGTYLAPGWEILSDGNDIVDVAFLASGLPTGTRNAINLQVETTNKQFGICQILEAKDARKFIAGTGSLAFDAKIAAADDNTHSLKAVILSWAGPADAVTRDVVDTWGATCTFAANWTAENVAASNTLTTSWQTFKIENVSIDTALAQNIAVFIYCDQTDGVVDDAISITNVKLEPGAISTPILQRPYSEEEKLCSYRCKPFTSASVAFCVGNGSAFSTTQAYITVPLGEMRSTPDVLCTAADWKLSDGAAGTDVTALTRDADLSSRFVAELLVTVAAGLTQWRPYMLLADSNANRRLVLQCEL